MLRRSILLLAVLTAAWMPSGGCRSCSDCHDYDPPVMGCESCGYGHRAGSVCGGEGCGCGSGGCSTGGCSSGGCGCGQSHGGYSEQYGDGQSYEEAAPDSQDEPVAEEPVN